MRQYDAVEQVQGSRLTVLRLLRDRVLGKSETTVYTEDRANVHDLEATSPVCVLLNLVFEPFEEEARNWYFPVSPLRQQGEHLLATRVRGSARYAGGNERDVQRGCTGTGT